MKKYYLPLIILCLCGCQTTGGEIHDQNDPYELADKRSCAELADGINTIETIIENRASSPKEELVKDTAVSAAKTGVSVSGVLGSAGAFAGLGLNFITDLYKIDSREREAKALEEAYNRRDTYYEAYELKQCGVP